MMDNKMTLFYSIRTGEIKAYTTGVTDMGYFGDDEEDFKIIYDYIVLDRDDGVLYDPRRYKIEQERKLIKKY